MIQAISAINSYKDPEYMRIMRELMTLGIAPTGNKDIDKEKVENGKANLIEKIQEKGDNTKSNATSQAEYFAPPENVQDPQRAELETQRLGAMNVAELMKIYHQL